MSEEPYIPKPKHVVTHSPEMEFKSYLTMIKNSVGTKMFSSLFVLRDGKEFDALQNEEGSFSCAFFVSSILTIFKKIDSFHGTISTTIKFMKDFGWQEVAGDMKPGDILLWDAEQVGQSENAHIGFYVGDDKAVSTYKGEVILHHDHPNHKWSNIVRVYRIPEWGVGRSEAKK